MDRQLPLFTTPAPAAAADDGGAVGPAPVGSDVADLARELPHQLYLGTSSWFFPGWRGLVWDRATDEATLSRHGLRAYAQHPPLGTGRRHRRRSRVLCAPQAPQIRQIRGAGARLFPVRRESPGRHNAELDARARRE